MQVSAIHEYKGEEKLENLVRTVITNHDDTETIINYNKINMSEETPETVVEEVIETPVEVAEEVIPEAAIEDPIEIVEEKVEEVKTVEAE